MSTEAKLKLASDNLTAQIAITEEKRQAYRAQLVQGGRHPIAWYEGLCVAALAYAAAADRLEELHEEYDDVFADWQHEQLQEERFRLVPEDLHARLYLAHESGRFPNEEHG